MKKMASDILEGGFWEETYGNNWWVARMALIELVDLRIWGFGDLGSWEFKDQGWTPLLKQWGNHAHTSLPYAEDGT